MLLIKYTIFQNNKDKIFTEARLEIARLLEKLKMVPRGEFQMSVFDENDSFVYTKSNMEKLEQWTKDLKIQMETVKRVLHSKLNELHSFWSIVEEEGDYCKQFTADLQGKDDMDKISAVISFNISPFSFSAETSNVRCISRSTMK